MYVSILIWYLANVNCSKNVRHFKIHHKISNNILRMIDEIENEDLIQRINKSKRLVLEKD